MNVKALLKYVKRLQRFVSKRTAQAVACIAVPFFFAVAYGYFPVGSIGKRRKQTPQIASSQKPTSDNAPRIPLRELIKFKERQWFLEEVKGCKENDPSAMLRIAKMYLHGQGCRRNALLAVEWIRQARRMGLSASLEDIYATDDPEKDVKLRQMIALEAESHRLGNKTPKSRP